MRMGSALVALFAATTLHASRQAPEAAPRRLEIVAKGTCPGHPPP
ncbi:hypothetical protein P0F65_07550 [Sphingomonas sp. I4]